MITEAKAERTCWDESDDSSYEENVTLVKVPKISKGHLMIDTRRQTKKINNIRIHHLEKPKDRNMDNKIGKELHKVCTFTHGRICWIASSGLNIRQNLVTLPAAAMRTSASLSRSKRT